MHDLKRQLSNGTKLANFFRGFLKFRLAERVLAKLTYGKGRRTTVWKLVPPEYLYNQPKIHRVLRDGVVFDLDLSNYNDFYVFYGLPEPRLEYLLSFVRPDFVVVDIGANMGYTALNIARRCPVGFVYGYEPDKLNFEKLTRNVELNHFGNIKVNRKALGNAAGELELVMLNKHHTGMNRLLSPRVKGTPLDKVQVVRLDDEATQWEGRKIDLIKIDVEGYEWNVLQGAIETIQKWKPILFIELIEQNLQLYGHSSAMVVTWLKETGYRMIDTNTKAPFAERSPEPVDTDILCFPVS